ncbi:hypothetical protein NDU88_004564 [Pleurodeles waltl]|uniref:Uncharacterized protein n=1 Tax=Pleurodeles waltl TaxID=8319 RepID=A0AAV7TSB5_PLEWA|nr:hypothetical protein NDU88_004564 [Pleurodeles waltl]
MFCTCPTAEQLWGEVSNAIMAVTGCTNVCIKEGWLLGLLKRSKAAKAANRFIDLALLMAHRLIAMHWKAHILPGVALWCAASLKWGKAEAVVLRLEETCGLRRIPIAANWETILFELHTYQEELHN